MHAPMVTRYRFLGCIVGCAESEDEHGQHKDDQRTGVHRFAARRADEHPERNDLAEDAEGQAPGHANTLAANSATDNAVAIRGHVLLVYWLSVLLYDGVCTFCALIAFMRSGAGGAPAADLTQSRLCWRSCRL